MRSDDNAKYEVVRPSRCNWITKDLSGRLKVDLGDITAIRRLATVSTIGIRFLLEAGSFVLRLLERAHLLIKWLSVAVSS